MYYIIGTGVIVLLLLILIVLIVLKKKKEAKKKEEEVIQPLPMMDASPKSVNEIYKNIK